MLRSSVRLPTCAKKLDKKLSCRTETARCFVSLNISLSHSRSLKAIENSTTRKLRYGFLFAFHSNYGRMLYHFRYKARYLSKTATFPTPAFDAPVRGVSVWIFP